MALRMSKRIFPAVLVFCAMALSLGAGVSLAEDAPSGTDAAGLSNSPMEQMKSIDEARKAYIYRNSLMRSPFEPLIRAKKKSDEMAGGKLPTQAYDVELMNLVAIVTDDAGGYGLIGLPDGKYYTIVKGTPIGIHDGKVVSITASVITILETVTNFKGELIEQSRELKLREEEE